MKKAIFVFVGAALIVSLGLTFSNELLPKTAYAQEPATSAPEQHLTITGAHIVYGVPHTLMITGANIDFDSRTLSVTLSDIGDLSIITASPSEIVVELPGPLNDDDYVLTVATGSDPSQKDEYRLSNSVVRLLAPQTQQGIDSETAALMSCGCGHINSVSCLEYRGCPGESQPRPHCIEVVNRCAVTHAINVCYTGRGTFDICFDKGWIKVPPNTTFRTRQTSHCKIKDVQLAVCRL